MAIIYGELADRDRIGRDDDSFSIDGGLLDQFVEKNLIM